MRIESRIVPSARIAPLTPPQVAREFRRALDAGASLEPAGSTRKRPRSLLTLGYTPKYKIRLFDATYYISPPRQNEDLRFFVAYVRLGEGDPGEWRIFPRLFYKDISLAWRAASHYIRTASENWIGKGDLKLVERDGEEFEESNEFTTDLPLEIQTALEVICTGARRIPYDDAAVSRVLRPGGPDRLEPFQDFVAPRRRAAGDPRNLVNRGRAIARFSRRNDPTSLRFTKGFEPDFGKGVVERSRLKSRMYGGNLRRFRIVSRNGLAQYLFVSGPRHAFIASVQATTTDLSSFGVRTIDANVDEDLLLPGFEYHFMDESVSPPVLHSQIPEGFAGETSVVDRSRADASAWLDRVPVIREFRRKVLRR
jgi:hypothetical protein